MASRIQNSVKNAIFAIGCQTGYTLINFITRTVFVILLNEIYLGLNGLFSNVLTVLSLAELGIGDAIAFSLYKPLANNDCNAISALMNFYKKVYRIIGIAVIAMGLSLAPFIKYFVTSETEIRHLSIYFTFYVFNTGVSYFYSYKKTLIAADQKQYLVTVYNYTFLFAQNVVQIIVLYTTKSFLSYLIVQLVFTLMQNVAISVKADKLYPYIKNKSENVSSDTLTTIKKNVKAMFLHKIGAAVVNSTDNIIISKFVNVVSVGFYSNYTLIIGALNQVIGQFFSAITASVGNLAATENSKKTESVFERIFFANFWLFGFSAICLGCLFQPFVSLWVGKRMLLPYNVVVVVIINFYLSGIRKTVLTFRSAMGLFWYDRIKPIFESVINLIASLILVKFLGLVGVFIGTTISTVTTSLWIEPVVLYRYGFNYGKKGAFKYFKILLLYTSLLIINFILNYFICEKVVLSGIFGFIIKAVLCVIISNLFFVIAFIRNKNFIWYKNFLLRSLKKKGKK